MVVLESATAMGLATDSSTGRAPGAEPALEQRFDKEAFGGLGIARRTQEGSVANNFKLIKIKRIIMA
jgi:hypothetical protein